MKRFLLALIVGGVTCVSALSASFGPESQTKLPLGNFKEQPDRAARLSDRQGGRPIDSQGGPDIFGYLWIDNQGGDSATYLWEELRNDPQALHLPAAAFVGGADDGVTNPLPIGFNFLFYGTHQQQLNICTNGNLQFVTSSNAFSNVCLPSSVHGAAIFPFWDDLHLVRNGSPSGDNKVHYKRTPTSFTVEWDSVGYFQGAGAVSMQVILYDDGKIKIQYKDLTGSTISATVGIQQSGTGTQLQYTCNATGFLAGGRAVWYYRCDVQPPPGYFPEGEPLCFDEYDDFYNSGCNSPDQIFQPIGCGQSVLATSGTFLFGGQNARDTDWFQLFLPEPMQVTWQVTAEFEVRTFIILPGPGGDCDGYTTLSSTTAAPCQTAQLDGGCLGPGVVWLWAGPIGFTGVPCGAEYVGTVTCTPGPPQPPNDNCINATPLSGEPSIPFSNLCAQTDGPDEPALCTSGGDTHVRSDIWYLYAPDCDGNLTISLCGSNYDTKLAIYQTDQAGTCPVLSSAMACNDDFCGLSSQVTIPVSENFGYLVRVGGWNGGQGDGILTITREFPCPPAIPCVSVGYIQISPSDGLLNHYGRINTCRVELTNLEGVDVTIPLTISDCEQTINYNVSLLAGECRLATLPFAWTPNIECQPNFISVSVPWQPPCSGNQMYTKPLPVPFVPFQVFSRHSGEPSPDNYFHVATVDIVLTEIEIQNDPCTIEYVRFQMSSGNPDTLRDPIDAVIYDNSGPGGTPGNILAFMPSLTTRSLENYLIYGVPIQSIGAAARLYVGFRNGSDCAAGLEGIAVDEAYDHPGTTYLQSGANWIPINPAGDFMIDVYTRCPCPTQGSNPVFGYDYITSDDPLGPEFNWVDISTVGTAWSDSCPTCNPIDPPWTPDGSSQPPTFGQDWITRAKISLNGFISFQLEGLGADHMAMPDPALPNAVVAPLWTECESCLDYVGEVYWYGDPNTGDLIVQWDSVLAQDTDYLTFEAIIRSNGDILFQYQNTPNYLDYTVGLESADGTQALVVYQEGGCPPLHDNFAILFHNSNSPPGVEDLTVYRAPNLSSNTVLRWGSVAPTLYYSVYANNVSNFTPPGQGTYLGTTQATSFTDVGAVNTNLKRFYRVIAGNMPPQGGNDAR